MAFFLSMLLSLLPAPWRERLQSRCNTDAVRGAFWSGVAEFSFCGLAWVLRFLYFIQYRLGTLSDALIQKSRPEAMGSVHVQFGSGTVSYMEYIIQPVSLLLLLFVLEGLARFGAALFHGEVLPSLSLQLLAWTGVGIQRRRHEAWMGGKVVDEVLHGSGQDFELRIASCRPKPWTAMTTISYQDQLFEMFKQELGERPRRFIYLLRKAPPHKIVRGLHEYDPEEVVRS